MTWESHEPSFSVGMTCKISPSWLTSPFEISNSLFHFFTALPFCSLIHCCAFSKRESDAWFSKGQWSNSLPLVRNRKRSQGITASPPRLDATHTLKFLRQLSRYWPIQYLSWAIIDAHVFRCPMEPREPIDLLFRRRGFGICREFITFQTTVTLTTMPIPKSDCA